MLPIAQQMHLAVLVWVEFANAMFIEIVACEPAKFMGAELGLGFEPERVEWPAACTFLGACSKFISSPEVDVAPCHNNL